LRRKLLLSIAAAAVLVAVVAGAVLVFSSDERGFTDQAKSILSPVEETTGDLADALEATKSGNDLEAVGQSAGELNDSTDKGLDKARDLDSADLRQAPLVDFLEATQAYARDVRAAVAKLTFKSASKAERAGRAVETSRQGLESADSNLPLPDGDDYAAAKQLSALAKTCGGVPPGSVVLVGDQAVTKDELNKRISQATSTYRLQGGTLPLPVEQYQILSRNAVDLLVDRIQFAESAKQLGVTVTSAEVKQRLREIKKQFFGNDEAAFQRQLALRKLTEAEVEDDLRAQVLRERVLEKVAQGARNKKARKRAWTAAMKKSFARKTVYRASYAPPGAKSAPGC
jgi:SurA-like N-terminal domain